MLVLSEVGAAGRGCPFFLSELWTVHTEGCGLVRLPITNSQRKNSALNKMEAFPPTPLLYSGSLGAVNSEWNSVFKYWRPRLLLSCRSAFHGSQHSLMVAAGAPAIISGKRERVGRISTILREALLPKCHIPSVRI